VTLSFAVARLLAAAAPKH